VPAALGFAAGYVDGCTFVALFGLFVAQVTGSFVIAGAVLVAREHGTFIKVLAVPVFLLGAAVATRIVSVARREGWREHRRLYLDSRPSCSPACWRPCWPCQT
jgi:uncharacterized membrane protein YoaK (UPF0700 family)